MIKGCACRSSSSGPRAIKVTRYKQEFHVKTVIACDHCDAAWYYAYIREDEDESKK